jgi:predicted Zn finger-like uncharacterized protein
MFTVCPKCALTLVVTTEDLRVAQGYVRCGRCSSVFNALARLAEDRGTSEQSVELVPAAPAAPAASPPSEPTPPRTPPPASPVPVQAPEAKAPPQSVTDEDAIPADALEFDPTKTDVSSVFVEPPPNPQWTAATGTFKAMIAANQEAAQAPEANAPPQSVTDEDAIPADALEFDPSKTDVSSVFVEPPPDPQWTAATGTFKPVIATNQEATQAQDSDGQIDVEIDPELLASILHMEPPVPPAPTAARPPVTPAPISRPRPRAREATRAADAPTAAASAARQPAPRPAPPPARPAPEAPVRAPRKTRRGADVDQSAGMERLLPHLWRAGAGVAFLVLLAQIVNHYRDQLAATARWHRPLTALYTSLGVPLVPRWDLRAYEVRQLGASVEPTSSGVITVRASIKNAAPQPQPLPLLRVTLQDRFGNRIAARDVAPPSYLPHAPPASALLSAGERIDAEMGFVDPGANAVGFEIDACLPTSGGGGEVTCASDASAR